MPHKDPAKRLARLRERYEQDPAYREKRVKAAATYRAKPGVPAARAEAAREKRAADPEYLNACRVYAHLARTEQPLPEPELDKLVLLEAARLARLRTQMLGARWEIDHITALSRGGDNAGANIQVVPEAWNRAKHNRHAERFLGADERAHERCDPTP